jgi:aspartokinase-like uncharacterized kinase
MGPVVIKVGGSLLDWEPLAGRLRADLDARHADRPVLLAGGGRAADLVRDLDRVHGLGDRRAHALALRALDLTAHLLAALVPGLEVVEALDALDRTWACGRTPVLAPRRFLDEDDRRAADPLPHSWSVTTDAIAARLARRLDAEELVLLKSAPLPPESDRAEAARLGLVDAAFPEAARWLRRVVYLNYRDPAATALPI